MTACKPPLNIYGDITYLAGWSSLYCYMADLLCLDSCRPKHEHSFQWGVHCRQGLVREWEKTLAGHPDPAFARYICRGLRDGFRIGFRHGAPLKSATRNMESAQLHPDVVSEYLQEGSLGRMLGLFAQGELVAQCHISRFGVIPKGHGTGKFRLITDLSFPPAGSVNDGIESDLCSLTYITVEEVAAQAATIGKGALLAKTDIEAVYRLVPVHPQDRILQAVQWEGYYYIDPMLPFGLRSAPKIFNALADALHWHLVKSRIASLFHYLDDYIMVAPLNSHLCQFWLSILLDQCQQLGVPIATHKTEGPATTVTFLGIHVDTLAGELRLPQDKLTRLQELLRQWERRKSCTCKELESLIGLLNHACKVIRPGRAFLRCMIDLL